MKKKKKLVAEIEGIKNKERRGNPCKQYSLKAIFDGWYDCYEIGQAKIFLNKGEIWKIGKTCLDENKRYPNGFPDGRLLMFTEFSGTAKQCLIVEKMKLYAYIYSKENTKRTIPLTLPPGNKQFK